MFFNLHESRKVAMMKQVARRFKRLLMQEEILMSHKIEKEKGKVCIDGFCVVSFAVNEKLKLSCRVHDRFITQLEIEGAQERIDTLIAAYPSAVE